MFGWFKKKESAVPLSTVPLLSIIDKGSYEENDPFQLYTKI